MRKRNKILERFEILDSTTRGNFKFALYVLHLNIYCDKLHAKCASGFQIKQKLLQRNKNDRLKRMNEEK